MRTCFCILLIVSSVAFAKDKGELSDKAKLAVRDAQVAVLSLQAQQAQAQAQCVAQLAPIQSQQLAAVTKLQAAIDKAFADAGVSKDEYDLDSTTLTFTPKASKPKPAEAPRAPEPVTSPPR